MGPKASPNARTLDMLVVAASKEPTDRERERERDTHTPGTKKTEKRKSACTRQRVERKKGDRFITVCVVAQSSLVEEEKKPS
jgi:hypothetical protein